MADSKFEDVIAQVARKHHTTPDHVRAEKQYAMDMAMQSPTLWFRKNGHPSHGKGIDSLWRNLYIIWCP